MTNEERQALKNRILNIKLSGKANRYEITELAELALVALTAPQSEPVGYFVHTLDEEGRGFAFVSKDEDILPGSFPLYTAPPSPVMKPVKIPDAYWCGVITGTEARDVFIETMRAVGHEVENGHE